MRTSALFFLALCAAGAADVNRLTDAERRDGWRLLFDGATAAGWVEITGKPFPERCWKVEYGCLRALPRPDGFQDIRTRETFRSFELEFDWKILKGGNTGVKYLIQRVDEWSNAQGRQARARGLEYQLADDGAEGVDGEGNQVAGALYSLIAPAPRLPPRIAEFNHSRLVVRGTHVEHWLNGRKVVEFDTRRPDVQKLLRSDLAKDAPPGAPLALESPISLQNHNADAWFRNIKIRVP